MVADPEINDVTCACSAQSGKTVLMQIGLAYVLSEDPGPALWVTANEENARADANTKIMPTLMNCVPLRDKIPKRAGKNAVTSTSILFPGAPLYIVGAGSKSKLQSKPCRYLFLDEVHQWQDKGKIELVNKRTRSYHNRKRWAVGCPEDERDPFDCLFREGDMRRYHVRCPHCGEMQPLEWGDKESKGGMKWTMSVEAYNGGKYRWKEIEPTIHYACRGCGGVMFAATDIVARKEIQRGGKWVPQNELAPENKRSYSWNVLLPWWTDLVEVVQQFFAARDALKRGDSAALKVFYNQTLGVPWSVKMGLTREDTAITERMADYDPNVAWTEEKTRFMTVDVQGKGGEHYYWVVRAWSAFGASRLLAFGIAYSSAELREHARQWGVAQDHVF